MNCFESITEISDEYEKDLRIYCLNSDNKILAELKDFPFIEGYCYNLAQYWQFPDTHGNEVYIHLLTRGNSTSGGNFNIKIAIDSLRKEIKNLEILASEFISKQDDKGPQKETREARLARNKRGETPPKAIQQCLSPEALKAARKLLAHWETLERKLTTDNP
jgi:hypothetical protein